MDKLDSSSRPHTSRRDFLKMIGVGAGAVGVATAGAGTLALVDNVTEATKHTLEIGTEVEFLRSIARGKLSVPKDWPGEKSRLLENRDYRSPTDIFDDAIQKIKSAGVTPVFEEPKESIGLIRGSEIAFSSYNQLEILIKNGEIKEDDLQGKIDKYAGFLMKYMHDNPITTLVDGVDGIQHLIHPSFMSYSGISQRVCESSQIVRSWIDENKLISFQMSNGQTIASEGPYGDIPDEIYSTFRESLFHDLENILNILYIQRVDQNKPLSMSDLIATTTILNKGDVISGITDAELIMKLLTRNEIQILKNENNKIQLSEQSMDDPNYRTQAQEKNINFLAFMFKDEFSLVASMSEITKVHLDNPSYNMPFQPHTDLDSEEYGARKDFHLENRGGGWYHGLSIMLEYAFLRPEVVNATEANYYKLYETVQAWNDRNPDDQNTDFLKFLRDNSNIQDHGFVKTLSDLAILPYGNDLYNKFRSLKQ